MLSRLNHVAIAVRDLPGTLQFYKEVFGLEASPITKLPSQGVRIAAIVLDNLKLEFIEPLDEKSPVSNFLAKRGDALHHVAFETSELHNDVEHIRSRRVRTLSRAPSTGYDGRPIIFLNPKDTRGVLIELEEAEKE